MNSIALLKARRSIREFAPREVTRAEVEMILDAAISAPNHRLTQPWRFYVLGPEARRGVGLALGSRKAKKIEDPTAADAMRQKIGAEHEALPLMIAVAVVENENPEIREEDYAAGMMAVHSITIAALDLGLGTHIKTGAVMSDPAARAAIGVAEEERVIAMLNLGEPATVPPPRARHSADSLTTWMA